MDSIYGKCATITLMSIAISVAITGGSFYLLGLEQMAASLLMAFICPLLIGPPVTYYYFKQSLETERLCVELAEANAALQQASKHLAELVRADGLTRLLNRNAFFSTATEILERNGGAMLMIDADHFKLINDMHGHAAGDAALVAIAHALKTTAPEAAIVGRLGGEEFAVLAPGLDGLVATELADRIREAVAACKPSCDRGTFDVTISVGVATGRTGVSIDALYRAADHQLLRAKRDGRNRSALLQQELAA